MNRTIVRLGVFLVVVAAVAAALVFRDQINVEALTRWLGQFGGVGPIVFILIYALGTVLFFPGSLLTLAGGAMFGPVWGTFYNLSGATLGATLAFVLARYLVSDWVDRKASGRLMDLKRGVEEEGWRFVAFVRLVPLFPFNILNYALGLTRIKLGHYILATYVCMLPGAIAYTYLGYAGREAVAGGEGVVQKALLALALLAAALFLPRLVSRWRLGPALDVAELHERLTRGDAPHVVDVRSASEFSGEQGHIPGAINVPVDSLEQRVEELRSWMHRPVIVVSEHERRSAQAARVLAKCGFTDVHVARKGMRAWRGRAFPIQHVTQG